MAAAATTGFPWGWDAVTAISTSVLVLGLGISAAYNAPIPETKFGVFRM